MESQSIRNFDQRISKQWRLVVSQKVSCNTTMTLTMILLLGMVSIGYAKNDVTCPSVCSCTVESTVFCNNRGLKTTPLDFTPLVEKLYLFNNNISTILPKSLEPMKNLKILDISGNQITNFALWDGIFSDLKLLENLMLQENRITKITSDMFKGLTNLARIYLHSNQISVIEDGAFSSLTNLVELKLRNNKITSFPKFELSPNLLLLDLGYNRIRTIQDMALSTVNVEHLLLQHNRLTQLRTSVFDDTSSISHLDISNNRLTAVPQIVKSLESLATLNMSLNKIHAIPRDTFAKLKNLKTLDLHNMSLKFLPDGIIPTGVILNFFDVTGNNWDCTCDMKWFPRYLRTFQDAFVNPDVIKCSAESKLPGQKIKDLHITDFDCSKSPSSFPINPTAVALTTQDNRKTQRIADPCDVYHCFNGGTCTIENNFPKCSCSKGWKGSQCQTSLTTPATTKSTTTMIPTTTRKTEVKPKLLINKDSITTNSVEIILPLTDRKLLMTIAKIGQKEKPNEFSITPIAQPFTVEGLESGRSYNICIHLPLSSRRSSARDSLCGTVKTHGVRVANTPVAITKITVVPSSEIVEPEIPTENTKTDTTISQSSKSSTGEKFQGDNTNPESSPTENTEFQILYPALGAGLGALVILVLLVLFICCYRRKRKLIMKRKNEYIPGSPVDSNHTDMEMSTVVHHHHHNHYNATGTNSNAARSTNSNKLDSPKSGKEHQQNNIAKDNQTNSVQYKTSIGSSSNSSNSSIGGVQYSDRPLQYSPSHNQLPPVSVPPLHYDVSAPQMNGRANEFLYRNYQANNPRLSVPNNHCVPQSGRYDVEIFDNLQQPLAGSMGQYHYGSTDAHLHQNPRTRSSYLAHQGVPPAYRKTSPISAFVPIQTPRNNNSRTPTSESIPITTQVNTARVIPTAACFNRNLINENMPRYHDGVQVV